MKRVVVTGIGGLSPLGNNWQSISTELRAGRSGISRCTEWDDYPTLRSRIAGHVHEGPLPSHFDRKKTRSMSRAAVLAALATENALQQADLLGSAILNDGSVGVAYGSCLGGADALMEVASACLKRDFRGIPASSYMKVMSHSCAANISLFFGTRGRIIPTCSACTSGSQAIGFSFEAIRSGVQRIMLAGGAEELCVGLNALFDALCATSQANQNPSSAPRPFDRERDGIVLSEGACTFVLEDLESAEARGVPIIAEVVGFGTNSAGNHISNPGPESMSACMRLALQSAALSPDEICFVHAHATATELGDIAEAEATADVFGDRNPVTALKSYFGHTLGAAGALETWLSLEMLREGWVAPIKNLNAIDPRCASLHFVQEQPLQIKGSHVMINNFAFGGVNTSLILKRWT